MFDNDHRHFIFRGQFVEHFKNLDLAHGVQLRCWFIQNQQPRLHHQHRSQRQTLLLPARQSIGAALRHIGQAGRFQHPLHAPAHFWPRQADIFEAESHFFFYREARTRNLVKGIRKHEPDLAGDFA
mgnify:CR=1 FL=1